MEVEVIVIEQTGTENCPDPWCSSEENGNGLVNIMQ